MPPFETITRGRLATAMDRGRISAATRAQLTQRTQRLIEQRRAEEEQKHEEERQSRHRQQAMIAGGVLGGVGGLAAAPLLASAFPALTAAGAVTAGVGLGTATGVSSAMFGSDLASRGMNAATQMFGNLPVDWGDVLNGNVFKAGLMDPADIPLSSMPNLSPDAAGVVLPTPAAKTGAPETTVGQLSTQPMGKSPETPLGTSFARPRLARLGERSSAVAGYLPAGLPMMG